MTQTIHQDSNRQISTKVTTKRPQQLKLLTKLVGGPLKMDELTDFSSSVVEFKALQPAEKLLKFVENSTGTDPLPPRKDIAVATNGKCEQTTQTEIHTGPHLQVDDKKLRLWLQQICPVMEAELLKGPTPLLDNFGAGIHGSIAEEVHIETYQKIAMGALEHSQGLTIWLSVHTNNAPVLVATTVAPHDDWCEHVNQCLKLFVPKRLQTGSFVVFSEVKSVPVKACLKSLSTNAYNKSRFAGSTLDGDIYIWQYEQSTSSTSVDVKELFNATSPHGFAVAMDWAAENRLLSCHANGVIIQWLIGKQMLKEAEYTLTTPPGAPNEITSMICLNLNEFVVGTKDGGVYYCYNSSMGPVNKELEIMPLKRHLFMVSTLLKAMMRGRVAVISCDLSGQVYYHDIRNEGDDAARAFVRIPLPFKNAIGCSRDGSIIYCPGTDGCLECYRIRDGVHSIVKGALQGKGNLIQCSDNGRWIITGLYGDEFQVFYVEY